MLKLDDIQAMSVKLREAVNFAISPQHIFVMLKHQDFRMIFLAITPVNQYITLHWKAVVL